VRGEVGQSLQFVGKQGKRKHVSEEMSGQVEDKGMVLTVRDGMRGEVGGEAMREESKVCL
jgi:hypothetical protein